MTSPTPIVQPQPVIRTTTEFTLADLPPRSALFEIERDDEFLPFPDVDLPRFSPTLAPLMLHVMTHGVTAQLLKQDAEMMAGHGASVERRLVGAAVALTSTLRCHTRFSAPPFRDEV